MVSLSLDWAVGFFKHFIDARLIYLLVDNKLYFDAKIFQVETHKCTRLWCLFSLRK